MVEIINENKQKIINLKIELEKSELLADSIKIKEEILNLEFENLNHIKGDQALSSTMNFNTLYDEVQSRPRVPRYETGIAVLDRKFNGGIEIGTFIQLAGESFAGKTHLVLEVLTNVAKGNPVMLFNFEMGDRRISSRLNALLKTDESRENFLINSRARTLDSILKEIRARARKGVKFFGIDSKMKIEVPDEETDLQKYRRISHELAKLAQEDELIIILINQMNESDIKDNRMSLKGGGDQMYDADIALFYLVDKKDENPNNWTRRLYCSKNRQDEELFSLALTVNQYGTTVEEGAYEVEYEEATYEMPNV